MEDEDGEGEDEEDEETDVESDGEAVKEVHELFQANSVRERKLFKLTCEEGQHCTGLRIKINNTLKSLYLNADAVDNNDDEPNLC